MSKLQKAINHFSKRHVESGTSDYYILAEALEEVRDHIISTNSAVQLMQCIEANTIEERPATFEPWHDVVEIVGPQMFGETNYTGFQGHVTISDEANWIRIFIPEDECHVYCKPTSLKLVYRLKPRAQAEPQPVFKAGDWIYDEETDRQEEVSEVHDRTVVTKAGRILYKSLVKKIDKPAPFQVGDWVQRENGNTDKIAAIGEWWVDTERGHTWPKSTITKIDPPAPRFTFGDRVRVEQGRIIFRFICASDTHAQILEEDTNITHHVPLHTLTLDTAAD